MRNKILILLLSIFSVSFLFFVSSFNVSADSQYLKLGGFYSTYDYLFSDNKDEAFNQAKEFAQYGRDLEYIPYEEDNEFSDCVQFSIKDYNEVFLSSSLTQPFEVVLSEVGYAVYGPDDTGIDIIPNKLYSFTLIKGFGITYRYEDNQNFTLTIWIRCWSPSINRFICLEFATFYSSTETGLTQYFTGYLNKYDDVNLYFDSQLVDYPSYDDDTSWFSNGYLSYFVPVQPEVDNFEFIDLLDAYANIPVTIFKSFFDWSVFGTTLLAIIGTIISVLLVVFIIKKVK